jgi:hypothetical protein
MINRIDFKKLNKMLSYLKEFIIAARRKNKLRRFQEVNFIRIKLIILKESVLFGVNQSIGRVEKLINQSNRKRNRLISTN